MNRRRFLASGLVVGAAVVIDPRVLIEPAVVTRKIVALQTLRVRVGAGDWWHMISGDTLTLTGPRDGTDLVLRHLRPGVDYNEVP